MPELPEVETTRLGITAHITGQKIRQLIVRNPHLRWPVPNDLPTILPGQQLKQIQRRGKYLLFSLDHGCALLHLGMSGSLRITDIHDPDLRKHDHVDWIFENDTVLRFNDPRRFGALLWTEHVDTHPLLASLGPEPLSDVFDAGHLFSRREKRTVPIKSLIMDSHIVVGVGNIYASEALFKAGILPTRPALSLTLQECAHLVEAIKQVLAQAIEQGGTTLRDFRNPEGKPGYFQQELSVYGRLDQNCQRCAGKIQQLKIAQRASYFCPDCQS